MNEFERPFRVLMEGLSRKEIGKAVKSGYRKTANLAAKEVRDEMHRSGLKVLGDRRSLDRSVRVRVFPRGGGFLVTTKPRGRQGFHKNRYGKEKPVAMWAAEGTVQRFVRRKGFISLLWRQRGFSYRGGGSLLRRGQMPRYDFVDRATPRALLIVETELGKQVEAALVKVKRKVESGL